MNLKSIGMGYFFAIPDAISFLNLVFGFLAILMVFNQNLYLAASFVIIAAIFDSIDGWVARKVNRNDVFKFGMNIDSLCDIVSFGAAPAAILYGSIQATGGYRIFVIFVCLVMLFCGLLRLARYNVISDKIDYEGFVGFPIPGMAMILVTYGLSGCFNGIVALILMLFACYLMISTIKYPKIKDVSMIAIAGFLILLILVPIDIVVLGINVPALLLFILILIYMLIPFLEFFLEVDGLFTKENAIKQVNKAKQATEVKFSESKDKAESKLNDTKDMFSDIKDAANKVSNDDLVKDDNLTQNYEDFDKNDNLNDIGDLVNDNYNGDLVNDNYNGDLVNDNEFNYNENLAKDDIFDYNDDFVKDGDLSYNYEDSVKKDNLNDIDDLVKDGDLSYNYEDFFKKDNLNDKNKDYIYNNDK